MTEDGMAARESDEEQAELDALTEALDQETEAQLIFFNYMRAMIAVVGGMLIEKEIITIDEWKLMESKARELAEVPEDYV